MIPRKNSRPSTILKYAFLAGGAIVLSLAAPLGSATIAHRIIRSYIRKRRIERKRILQDLRRLQERKLIEYRESGNGTISVVLTKRGKAYGMTYQLDTMKLRQGRWDKKWRIVMFDISDSKKNAREAFRKKLKDLGRHPLQRSVYITPWPCGDELDFLCVVFEIPRTDILLFETGKFEGEHKLRHYFNLS